MNIQDFKVGDEVECNTSFEGYPQKGWRGRVVHHSESVIANGICVGVEWEQPFFWGTNGGGKGKNEHCRFYYDTQGKTSADLNVIKKKNQLQLELF